MKKMLIFAATVIMGVTLPSAVFAVTRAEDIATTIMLRGHSCGGNAVFNITETRDNAGNKTITATCPNGQRYRIDVSHDGRVVVTSIH